MKVKKLEINGFKSFPEKAVIEFPPGIAAFVGPNGCGKSNIIDAMRWVMGEQSVKQLRGKAMEDVIFSGTNGKPPLNMTEVSLTLANDNGNAPEELRDFSEIMLTRRLYRSGESGYFINKQPCRLKDIHNLFMGSGIGSKSYAVVQQGNIGAITDAGPDERRFLVEEAAGITRYKSRKNETLRKIETTNQNLLRVTDIITEIKRQMNGLKRQSRKAERYKRLQDRVRMLDVCLAINGYDDFTRKIEETDTLLKDLKDKDIEHTSKLTQLDAAVEKIRLQRSHKNQEISDFKSKKFETHRTLDRLENDLSHLGNDVERLRDEVSGLESAYKDLEEKERNLKDEVAQGEFENVDMKSEMKNVMAILAQERSVSQMINEKMSILNQELETSKTNLMDLTAQEARYKNIYQNTASNKESLKRRLKQKNEEEAGATMKVTELRDKETKAKEKIDSISAEITDLDERIGVIRKQLEEKSNTLGRQVKRVQTLEYERNKTKSKYTALKKMEDNFEWYKGGVRAIMKQSSLDKNEQTGGGPGIAGENGIMGLMADILEPEPSFETAVEAALGESLQYILVKDQETCRRSIDYLQTTGAGRSGFIPVSSLKNVEFDPKGNPDPPKLLLNHVTVPDGFQQIAEALLGHVVVAADITEAMKVFGNNGARQTVVTKNGDIITHQGIMIGGSSDNLSGILSKKQELKELKRKITNLDKKLESARHDQKALESEVRIIESNTQKLIEQKNQFSQNRIEAEKALYQLTEKLKHAHRHLEIVRLEQEQLMGEEIDIDSEMVKYNKAVAEVETRIKAAQKKVTETTQRIGVVTSEMEDHNQRIVDLKLQQTSLNARLENSSNTLRRLKEFQSDSLKQREQISREIAQKNQRKIASKQNIAKYEEALSEMYVDMKRLESELESSEAEYQAIDAKLRDSDNIISDIQSERENTLQKTRLLELEQSQQLVKRDNIENRLKERYHKPILEFRSEYDEMSNRLNLSIDEMEDELLRCNQKIEKITDVNLGAIKEYEQLKDRLDFLSEQREDLIKAIDDLHKVIKKINRITQKRFIETFDAINEKIGEVFPRLFEGGSAKLVLTQPDKPLETGVEFMIHPPGKKLTRMSLLSGGEKALSAIALIFSIFLIKPASFCLMDEIDAPLDDVNIFRFNNLLQMIREKFQIIMITHNKRSMEFADTLFGITMENKGISKIVSVNFTQPES